MNTNYPLEHPEKDPPDFEELPLVTCCECGEEIEEALCLFCLRLYKDKIQALETENQHLKRELFSYRYSR